MSKENKSKIIEMKTLKEGSSVTIEIPYFLYTRIQNLLMSGIPFQDIEVAHKVLNSIKESEKDPDAVTYHTRTLLMLVSRIEEVAEKENKIEVISIDTATGQPV